ncbi:unnamed protein product [Timema podura]|uniref:Uncharacterized protein n=1 Tax=Timema podura TaxID=61482 RepID=A0ABN7NPR1_TIMPD|nr:unnamed protein product [Timema podura]
MKWKDSKEDAGNGGGRQEDKKNIQGQVDKRRVGWRNKGGGRTEVNGEAYVRDSCRKLLLLLLLLLLLMMMMMMMMMMIDDDDDDDDDERTLSYTYVYVYLVGTGVSPDSCGGATGYQRTL